MAYIKGKKYESGIWYNAEEDGYIVDIIVRDLKTRERIRFRQKTNRIDLAREFRDEKRGEAIKGNIRKKEVKPITFKAFADEYFEAWKADRKETTIDTEKRRINGILKPYFGKKAIHAITRKDIETFLRKRQTGPIPGVAENRRNSRGLNGISKASANRDLARLKNMFKYAVNWEYVGVNPAAGIQQAPEKIKEADFLEADEVRRFLEACEARYRLIFMVAIYTGIRYSKVAGLEWCHVDHARNHIAVRDTKNNDDRYIPMHPDLAEALVERRQTQAKETEGLNRYVFPNPQTGKPYRDLRKPMNRALGKAGIKKEGFRFHDLRHTTGSHLAMAGATEREIGEVLGHRDPKMSRRYSHLSPQHTQAVVNRLDFSKKSDVEAVQDAKSEQKKAAVSQ